MHAFKYHGRLALAEWAAGAILAERGLRCPALPPDRLVALPLARERERERGYNQAYEIGRAVARPAQAPLVRHGIVADRVRRLSPRCPEGGRKTFAALRLRVDLAGMSVAASL